MFLKLDDVPCLVIGGGSVAERKVENLLEAKASVSVISPNITQALQRMIDKGQIEHERRIYREGDLEGFSVVIAATNSREVNAQIYREAVARKALINSVDDSEHSSFIVPSVVRRGALQVAVSTSGRVPYFARKLRQYLEGLFYADIGVDLEQLQRLRMDLLRRQFENPDEKMREMSALLDPKIKEILEKMNPR